MKTKTFVLTFSTLMLMGACGKVRFALDKNLFVPLNVVTTIEEAAVKCNEAIEDGTMQTSQQNIIFTEKGECDWEVGDNLSKCDGKIRARSEQFVELDLPANATLCDMKLDFVEDPNMLYDDELILTLGGKVLFMTQDYSINSSSTKYQTDGLMVNTLGLVHYSWLGDSNGDNGLRGLFYGWQQAPQYGLGGAAATCMAC